MPKTVAAKAEKPAKAPKKAAEPKKEKGLGKVKEATLKAMKSLGGQKLTHGAIADVTKKPKGNQLRELTALGFVKTEIPQEGKREHSYSLTPEGRKVATKL
jgi:hypothetical protein